MKEMSEWKVLVCGSRSNFKEYKNYVLAAICDKLQELGNCNVVFIEGCCPNSADEYVEEYCEKHNHPIKHYPAKIGECMARDRKMAEDCNEVIAFWNGTSRGTLYTITQAVIQNKPVMIIPISEVKK